jgi:hypothetical protein
MDLLGRQGDRLIGFDYSYVTPVRRSDVSHKRAATSMFFARAAMVADLGEPVISNRPSGP